MKFDIKESDKIIKNSNIIENAEDQTTKVNENLKKDNDQGIKIVFLDVDGVLNCSTTKDRCCGYIGIDDKKVSFLKSIVEATNAKIILVSSWKQYWYKELNLKKQQDELADYLDAKLKNQNLEIIDKTEDEGFNRGDGIFVYLKELESKGVKVDKFIIIDDEIFDYKETKLLKNLIQTSFYNEGLQEKHVYKSIAKLSSASK